MAAIVFDTPLGPRALGRDTTATVANWDKIVASMPVAPKVFKDAGVPVPRKSPNIRRFHYMAFRSQRSRGFCFPAGTEIWIDGDGRKPIEAVEIGDDVATPEGRSGRVTRLFRRQSRGFVVVKDHIARSVRTTPEHPFLTRRGYVAANALRPDDEVAAFGYTSKVVQWQRVDVSPGPPAFIPEDVYNFEVEGDNSYIAEGFGVHNCVGFNFSATLMTRLRIPDGATDTIGEPLPEVPISALYSYDVMRMQCAADGYQMGRGDGGIGSCAIKGAHKYGCVTTDIYPDTPALIDAHRNGTVPPQAATEFGVDHIVQDYAICDNWDHGLEMNAAGFPLAVASSIPGSMMNCDPKGNFRMAGGVVGGHEYQVIDHDQDLNLAWIGQCWPSWGERSLDPKYIPRGGFSQIGTCPLDELSRWFSPGSMSNGSSEITVVNTVQGFAPPIIDYSAWD